MTSNYGHTCKYLLYTALILQKKFLQPEDTFVPKESLRMILSRTEYKNRLASPEIQVAPKIDIHESGLN